MAHCWPVGGGRVQIADPLTHEHPSRVWEDRGIKRHYGEIEQVLGDCLMRLGDEHVTSLAASAIPHHLHLQRVRYKTRTGPGPEPVIKCGPRLFIKHGLIDCMACHVYRATKSHEILMFFSPKRRQTIL